MFRTLLAFIFVILVASVAHATCADGGIACGAFCGTGSCTTANGLTFSGECIAAHNTSTAACKTDPVKIRCDGTSTPVCGGGPPQGLGCATDAQCVAQFGANNICVVDGSAGIGSCGTAWSACIKSCSDSTTTTTSTTTTSTSSSTST